MQKLLTGRCLCGRVRYECGARLYPPTLCHCESCRRASGAHMLGWVTVATGDLRYTAGTPREYASSPGRVRAFCGDCGSPLTYRCATRPNEVDVTIGTLDDPGLAPPVDHLWMEDAPAWDKPADGLPRYARSRA